MSEDPKKSQMSLREILLIVGSLAVFPLVSCNLHDEGIILNEEVPSNENQDAKSTPKPMPELRPMITKDNL